MKILVVNYEYPPLGGGAGNATANICREFAGLGHEVVVLTSHFTGLAFREKIDGYTVIRVRSKRARVDRSNQFEMMDFVWKAIRALPAVVREFQPDRSIAFFALPSGLVNYVLLKRYKIPYIISLRGGDVPGFLPKNLKRLHTISAPFTRLVWKNATHIVANSTGLKELAEPTAKPLGKTVEMIPNGVNTTFYAPDHSKRSVEYFTVLFVGRLTEQKGVTFILNALSSIKKSQPELAKKIRFTIVGDGPLRQTLEAEVRQLGIETQVAFVGWKNRPETREFYQSAHVFVLPSFEEGMPNVVLEAMACGLPIIATDVKGNDELVENEGNGFLYNGHEKLAGFIVKLASNPELVLTHGNASIEKTKRFSWKNVAEKLITLLS